MKITGKVVKCMVNGGKVSTNFFRSAAEKKVDAIYDKKDESKKDEPRIEVERRANRLKSKSVGAIEAADRELEVGEK
jgi:hypothetical protein